MSEGVVSVVVGGEVREARGTASSVACRSWVLPASALSRGGGGRSRLGVRGGRGLALALAVAVAAGACVAVAGAGGGSARRAASGGGRRAGVPAAEDLLARLPLRFELNVGQSPLGVEFVARRAASLVLLTASGLVVSPPGAAAVDLELVGSNPAAQPVGVDRLAGVVNYLIGNDPARWHRDVPGFAQVAYRDVYRGVDLVFRGSAGGALEYDFELAAGADPAAIGWAVAAGGSARVVGGDLVVGAGGAEVRQRRPVAYQVVGGRRRMVGARFEVSGGRVGFRLGGYDRRRPLVIDPVVEWQYNWASSAQNSSGGQSVALDGANNVYVTGPTQSADFPTTPGHGAFTDGVTTAGSTTLSSASANFTAADVGVTVVSTGVASPGFNGTGWPIVVGTTIVSVQSSSTVTLSHGAGGTATGVSFGMSRPYKNFSDGVATAGSTTFSSASANFGSADVGKAITSSALPAGTTIAAVVNPTAATLSAPASAGGSGVAFSVARAWSNMRLDLAGLTSSGYSRFVAKLNAAGTALVYSTYLGGTHNDPVPGPGGLSASIAVDSGGDAYVSAATWSPDYPTTANALQRSCGADGLCNAQPYGVTGTTTAGSPVFQGNMGDSVVGSPISGANIPAGTILAGRNSPNSFTLSANATGSGSGPATVMVPKYMAVVTKLDPFGSSLLYSSFLGGANPWNLAPGLALGGTDVVYVAGATSSFDLPTTTGAFQPRCGADGYCGAGQSGGASTAGSTTYTSTSATFAADDVGQRITGSNIAAGTTVASVTNATTIVLSQPATATGAGLTFAIYDDAQATAYLVRLNTAASGPASLTYGTFLGGSDQHGTASAYAVAADGSGNAYVTGATTASDFPVSASAYQGSFGQGTAHVFLSRLNTAASGAASLVYSTYLGGNASDTPNAVATDGSGDAWVAGHTNSATFPTTTGSVQPTCGGACQHDNGFVAKLNTAASGSASLAYSTFLGGSGSVEIDGVAVDHASPPNATFVGWAGPGFPQVRPMQGSDGTSGYGVIGELNGAGSALVYSTYLGSPGSGVNAVALDSAAHPVIIGPSLNGNGQGAVVKIDPTRDSGVWVTGISPVGGPVSGGTSVVVSGSGFTGATGVKFGSLTAPSFTVNSDSQITAVAPACTPGCGGVAAGTMAVTVSTPSGSSVVTSAATYYYGEGFFGPTGGACPSSGCGNRAVGLANGKVLSLDYGVVDATRSALAARIFDPGSGTWTATQSCPAGGATPGSGCGKGPGATLTALANGKVLLAGGQDPALQPPAAASTAAAFLYDSTAGTWAQTGSMGSARDHASATLLANGKVLVAGGCSANCGGSNLSPLASAEIYDPGSGSWSPTGSMATGRADDTATLLASGKVLAAGGLSGAAGQVVLASSEVFDPAGAGGMGAWSASGSMVTARSDHGAVALGGAACSGASPAGYCAKVLVVGGNIDSSGHTTASAELWDPAGAPNGTWSSAGSLAVARFAPDVVDLANGRVLVLSGDSNVAERYDPAAASWGSATAMASRAAQAGAVALAGGPASACSSSCGQVVVTTTPAVLYTPMPTVASVSPASGPAGTTVTVTGTGLAAVTAVSFGSAAGTNVVHDATSPDTKLTVSAPAVGGGVDVTVSGPGGVSATGPGDRFGVAVNVAPADFDGDGLSEVSVFRPSSGAWMFNNGQATVFQGLSGDVPVPCDYAGTGKAQEAVFRPSSGGWFIAGQAPVFFGLSGDVPVPGDYTGAGHCTIAVFRPSVGGWFINGQATVYFGLNGDVPVPGHYSGAAALDVAVFRPSVGGWYVQGQPTVYFGLNGDIPVPGNYSAKATTDVAVFRPSVGGWYRNGAATTYLGLSGDVPVPGMYNTAGTSDVAVFRPSTGAWYIAAAAPVYFGVNGDIPLPLPAAIRQAIPYP